MSTVETERNFLGTDRVSCGFWQNRSSLCRGTSFVTANAVLFLHSYMNSTDSYCAWCRGYRDE